MRKPRRSFSLLHAETRLLASLSYVRYVHDRPVMEGAIVGVRLSVAEHVIDNARVFGVALDTSDQAQLEAVFTQSQDLFQRIGDCGDE